jgi:hypothetical protein
LNPVVSATAVSQHFEYICVWPDGTYCDPEDLHEMSFMGDDYANVAVGPDEDQALVAQAHANQAAKAFTSVMQALVR